MIVAGEASGDLHGAGLVRAMHRLDPNLRFCGMGGRELRAAGVEILVDAAGMAVVGAVEVLSHLGEILRARRSLIARLHIDRPDLLILIDYPDFNLLLAARAKRLGIPILYYISPQVWAWKKGRVKVMAKVLDLMICIFPFEKEFYETSGLPTEFCGHPMVDRVQTLRRNWEREPGLVGWFPGSRLNEVKRLFPVMLRAALAIRRVQPAARFAVSAANETLAGHMRRMADAAGLPEAKQWIETGTVYDLMQRAQAGAVASGTATLEAACFGLPYALVYRVSGVTYAVAKAVVRIEHIGIINVLARREVVRELVQGELTEQTLASEMLGLLTDTARREALQRDLAAVVATLGQGGAYRRAAEAVQAALRG